MRSPQIPNAVFSFTANDDINYNVYKLCGCHVSIKLLFHSNMKLGKFVNTAMEFVTDFRLSSSVWSLLSSVVEEMRFLGKRMRLLGRCKNNKSNNQL